VPGDFNRVSTQMLMTFRRCQYWFAQVNHGVRIQTRSLMSFLTLARRALVVKTVPEDVSIRTLPF